MTPNITDTGNIPNLVSQPAGYLPQNSVAQQMSNLAMWHLNRIGNTGMLAAPPEGTSTQPLGSVPNPAATQRRVWLDEPPGSVPFDEQAAIPVPPADGLDHVVLTFTVPVGFDGVIKWISNNILSSTPPILSGQLI